MKKNPVLLLLLLALTACNVDDDANFNYELVPVQNATFPETFVFGSTYEIPVEFIRPTACHFFADFSFSKIDETTRRMGVVNSVFTDQDCADLTDSTSEMSFNFMVLYDGTYTFEFWNGEDANGEDQYIVFEVPVVREEITN